jgi:rhomboid protease GluP
LYGYFGLALFPFGALIGGALANLAVLPTYEPATELIGASGIVYWMGGAWLMLYFFVARQKARAPRWLRTVGVALLIFAPQSFEPQVSYRVHFVGFVIGLIAGGIHFFRHRARFRAAEVMAIDPLETIEPGDELPPPEGLR